VITPEIIRAIAEQAARQVAAESAITYYEAATTDATPTELATIEVDDNTGGMIEVRVVAVEANTAAFYYVFSYLKLAGDIVVDTPVALYEKDDLLAVSVSITGSSGNILIEVTGIAATSINWKGETRFINASTVPV
jgi:hypothetical protein